MSTSTSKKLSFESRHRIDWHLFTTHQAFGQVVSTIKNVFIKNSLEEAFVYYVSTGVVCTQLTFNEWPLYGIKFIA